MALMDTSEGTPGGGTPEFTVIQSGPFAGWRLETNATASGGMYMLRSPDGAQTLLARPGEFQSGIPGAQIIPGFGAVFTPEQASDWGNAQAGTSIFDYGPYIGAGIIGGGALSGLFDGAVGGVSGLEGATGAFDVGGSAGVFDSFGNPLYASPGVDVPWGVNPQPADATGAFDISGSEGVFPYESPPAWVDQPGGAMDMFGSTNSPTGTGLGGTVFDAYPVLSGTAGSSWLDRLFGPPGGNGGSGGLSGSDLARLLGGLGAAGLGAYGANQQADAYRDVANQYLSLGAPYRARLESSYQPDFNLAAQPGYGDAFQRMADISARSYSSRYGNPYDSPTAQAGILGDVWNQSYLPALSNYRGQLGQFGGLGLNTSGTASLAGAGETGGVYDALGFGLNQALNPQPSISDLIKQIEQMQRGGGMGGSYRLSSGFGV